jgi:hypothetical protein
MPAFEGRKELNEEYVAVLCLSEIFVSRASYVERCTL